MYDATLAETVTIRGDGGDEIEAYLARPMSQGPFGGVVVIHHMPGYDTPTKEITRKFAAAGYAGLMSYDWKFSPHPQEVHRHLIFLISLVVLGVLMAYQVERVHALSRYYERRPL